MTRPIEEIERMAEMNKTMSLGQIGEEYGIDYSTVYCHLKSRGFTPINHCHMDRQELVDLLNSGITHREIGKMKGVTKQAIGERIKAMGIKKLFY